ncbi:MAG: hypothetical protein KBT33_08955 [Prevotellaceae bacterium]|nr:hypothetical protein [Candidatus Minthosoma equi]
MEYTFVEMPDVHKNGKRVVYPRQTHCQRISYETFLKECAQYGVNHPTMVGAMDCFVRAMYSFISNGHSVKIDGVGTFDIKLGMAEGVETQTVKEKGELYDTRSVQVQGINFIPDKKWIKNLQQSITLVKADGIKELKNVKTTKEERLAIAKEYLAENKFMKIETYQYLTGLSRSAAYRELVSFRKDSNSGITTSGDGAHKVYVLR